uniref:EamA domain-containing protein n=1 Tax=Acrobeloides nanus TaxID=290746 RepID=A0A914C637_9BILA
MDIVVYPIYLVYAIFILKQRFKETIKEDFKLFGRRVTFLSITIHILPFLVVNVLTSYAYARGLSKIASSAAGILSGMNPTVVFIESLIVLREKFLFRKAFATLFVVGGIITISFDSEFTGSAVGIILVLASSIGSGTSNVMFKKVFGRPSLGKLCLYLSFIGLFNITLNIIPTVILVKTNVDRITWEHVPWGPVLGVAVLSLFLTVLSIFGIALLSPLVISIGAIFGLPLNAAMDIIFRNMTITSKLVIGVVLILISVLLISIPIEEIWENYKGKREDEIKKEIISQTSESNASITIEKF